MPIVRNTLAANLATILRAAVLPGVTDPQGNAVKLFASVYESVPDEVVDEDIPTCLIHIGDTAEQRLTDPVGFGVKSLSVEITLEVFAWVDASDDTLGARLLNTILDTIDTTLRAAPATISGAVSLAYDSVSTKTHTPVVSAGDGGEPAGKVLVHATRRFSAFGYDIG